MSGSAVESRDHSPGQGKEDGVKKDLKRAKKLHLSRETLSVLTREEINQAAGGNTLTCYFSCAYACQTIGGTGGAGIGRAEQPCLG
jgi:hypothetical protein